MVDGFLMAKMSIIFHRPFYQELVLEPTSQSWSILEWAGITCLSPTSASTFIVLHDKNSVSLISYILVLCCISGQKKLNIKKI
jgi:hypothetical protein